MVRVAVVGGGLVGSLVALLAARSGWDVDVLESRDALLSAASAANEGKVHLGPVFAMGGADTHGVMLRGALAFAPLIEEALGRPLDWSSMLSPPFEYLVMPGSLLSVEQLAARYAAMNESFELLAPEIGRHYVGTVLERVVDTTMRVDAATGLAGFATSERAIDPVVLCSIIREGVHASPRIRVLLSTRVSSLEPDGGRVVVTTHTVSGQSSARYDAAVNCAWEGQLELEPRAVGEVNFRLKAAVRLPPHPGARTVTLVQGPFGDVVAHRGYTYASWYPRGRLAHEFGSSASAGALRMLDALTACTGRDSAPDWAAACADDQVGPLQDLGLVPPGLTWVEVVGGMILGHGRRDIDVASSQLHSRSEFGVRAVGSVITPVNFKLTTAPLAAAEAVRALEALRVPTVVS